MALRASEVYTLTRHELSRLMAAYPQLRAVLTASTERYPSDDDIVATWRRQIASPFSWEIKTP